MKMKAAIVLLALVGLAWAAPQPRKSFHEHFDDFMGVIGEEAGGDLDHLVEHYSEFDEFLVSLDFVASKDFNKLIHEMEDLPEFKAVVEFLEGHEIDISYFIDMFNDLIDNVIPNQRKSRHELSGRDFNSFIQDSIAVFPKDKLAALFDEKKEEYEEFARAMDSLQGDEWKELWNALWAAEEFKAEVDILSDNGIEVESLLNEILAVFGQN